MKFQPYPKYKASGVSWPDRVPDHWTVKPLKFAVSMKSGEQITAEDISAEGVFPVFGGNGLRGYTSSFTHDGHFPLIGRQGALCGNVNYATGKFWASEHAVVVSPRIECSVTWLGELLRAMDLGQYSVTAAQPGLSVEAIGNHRIPFPPSEDQCSISAFLDRETAKLDTLIAKQERLIELLQEKRQAMISHAVTKGLDPSVPMKDSGIEWLGTVPERWKVVSVRRIVRRIEQGWSPECYGYPADDDKWGVVKSGCVNHGVFAEIENKAFPDSLDPMAEYEIKAGDVLMSRASGSPELVGSTAYVETTRSKLMLSDKIFRIHMTPIVDPTFFVAIFNSRPMRLQIERAISGADGLANNLPQSSMKAFYCVIPTINEQREIVSYIGSEIAKIDTLINKSRRNIGLMREHRTALISAAVTGKIDVREAA